jgi:tetratricopeptide (TPR) repeat protein
VSPLTRLGVAVGTVSYMSPEQASGGPVDARSDIFSLAVVIYEALAGELPFRGQSDREVLEAIRARDPEPLGEACPGLPPELAGIVARCLSKNPDERFPSATALREKLFDVAHAASRQPVSSWLRRGVVVGAIGLVALGVAMLFTPGRRSPPLAERPWTLIGDFENHTGDRLLELTFRELLTAALEQSQYLKVFPRSRTTETLQRMRRGAAEPLDRPTAREICRRENLNALIAGEMLTVPAGYRVVLRTIEPETDEVKDVLTDTFADKAAIWESVTRLAAKLRISLGEGSSEVSRHTRPLDEVTTRSFEALQSFSRASDLQREGRMDEARLLMASAVALDPEFAIAHARLATLWDAMGEEGEALRAAGRAYSLRERVSAHERYHIEGSYHSLRGEYERAAEAYGRLAALRPEDDAAQRFLAQSRGALGRLEEAVLSARRAAELRPSSIINQGYLAVLLAEANRNDEALGLVQRLASLSREGVYLRWAEGLAWLGKGSPEQAATAFHALAQEGGVYQDWGRLYLAQTSFYRGEWERARELLESDLRRDPSRMDRNAVTRAYWLARSESLRGRRSSALRVIESLEGARGPLARLEALNRAGVVYARLGVRDRAEAIAARLVALRDEFPSSLSRGLASHLNGELLLARGDLELALSELDRAREWLASVPVLEALARCHFARGDFERALSAYQEIEERRGTVLRWEFAFDLPLAQLGAARCLKALGRIEEASSRYEELLRQWSGASDLPSLREAERERDALRTDSNEL